MGGHQGGQPVANAQFIDTYRERSCQIGWEPFEECPSPCGGGTTSAALRVLVPASARGRVCSSTTPMAQLGVELSRRSKTCECPVCVGPPPQEFVGNSGVLAEDVSLPENMESLAYLAALEQTPASSQTRNARCAAGFSPCNNRTFSETSRSGTYFDCTAPGYFETAVPEHSPYLCEWIHPYPQCRPKNCTSAPPSPNRGAHQCTTFTEHDTGCGMTCDTGYEAYLNVEYIDYPGLVATEGASVTVQDAQIPNPDMNVSSYASVSGIVCRFGAFEELPTCEPKVCGTVPFVNNSATTCTGLSYSDTC
eukprot:CAMPEP_0204330004 /NCGR_PEP_ID=MMETSP0469-20131031/14589_1 /ASSEMBLY_ACC=CAM_ASM_000384 /TAXON_ID=2969 /ORGANISM="Oxyrrhis marina" /LENGTH=306 /DNA_ID=CAMNT_0051312709 /DNA_START=35 /DNA_END=952 /DNA_ORIENTATION=-